MTKTIEETILNTMTEINLKLDLVMEAMGGGGSPKVKVPKEPKRNSTVVWKAALEQVMSVGHPMHVSEIHRLVTPVLVIKPTEANVMNVMNKLTRADGSNFTQVRKGMYKFNKE